MASQQQHPPALRQYLEEVARARAEFGDDVVVVYHNGKFYDVYGLDGQGCDVQAVSRACNTGAFRRTSADRFWQCGLRSEQIEEKAAQLVDAGLTVVRMDQTAADPGARMQYDRARTRVYSPGAPPDVESRAAAGPLAVIYRPDAKGGASLGYASFDFATGTSDICELADAEALRRVGVRDAPRETVVVGWEDASGKGLEAFGKLRLLAVEPVTLTREHAAQTLRRVFPDAAPGDAEFMLNAPAMPAACMAFVQLLHVLHRRDPSALTGIAPPRKVRDGDRLVIRSDGLQQLDLAKTDGSVLPRCGTAAGARELRRRVAAPSRCADVIEERLGRVDGFFEQPDAARTVVKRLANLPDAERIERRLANGSAQPGEWVALARFCTELRAALAACDDAAWAGAAAAAEAVGALEAELLAVVAPDRAGPGFADPFFPPGVFPELDALHAEREIAVERVDGLLDALNGVAGSVPGAKERVFKLETRGGETAVTVTEAQLRRCRKELDRRDFVVSEAGAVAVLPTVVADKELRPGHVRGKDLRVAKRGSWAFLQDVGDTDSVNAMMAVLDEKRAAVAAAVEACHRAACGRVHDRCAALLRVATDVGVELDIAASTALDAVRRGRCRPTVLREGAPCLRAVALRHPAFDEAIDGDAPYVANDVALGPDRTGLLIYGANGSGKSCFMKSVGVAAVMAQAGLYVAADALEVRPFGSLFTRFPCGDDMYRGMSTFVGEMKEVQYMVECADADWLVIGDELCSGTNHVGGCAVVAAGLHRLRAKGACFVFATHMLNVARHVADLPGLGVCHFAVSRRAGGIHYERRLAPGTGDVNHTVDVCAALGFDADFMELAWRFNRLESDDPNLDYIVGTKASRYNAKVFVDRCAACGGAAEHTHHIVPQAVAKPALKNRRHNLTALCAACHRKEHAAEHAPSEPPKPLASFAYTAFHTFGTGSPLPKCNV